MSIEDQLRDISNQLDSIKNGGPSNASMPKGTFAGILVGIAVFCVPVMIIGQFMPRNIQITLPMAIAAFVWIIVSYFVGVKVQEVLEKRKS